MDGVMNLVVIRDGLRALFARDEAVERWLREEVAVTFDAWISNPDEVVTAKEIRTRMKTRLSSTT